MYVVRWNDYSAILHALTKLGLRVKTNDSEEADLSCPDFIIVNQCFDFSFSLFMILFLRDYDYVVCFLVSFQTYKLCVPQNGLYD